MKKRLLITLCVVTGCVSTLFFRSNEPTVYRTFADSDETEWQEPEVTIILERLTKNKRGSFKAMRDRIETKWHEAQQKQLQDAAQQGVLHSEGFTQKQIEAAVTYAREVAKKYNPFTRLDGILTEFEQGNWHTEKVFSVEKSQFSEDVQNAFSDLEITVIFLKDRFKPTAKMLNENLKELESTVANIKDPSMKEKFAEPLEHLKKLTDRRIESLKSKSYTKK